MVLQFFDLVILQLKDEQYHWNPTKVDHHLKQKVVATGEDTKTMLDN